MIVIRHANGLETLYSHNASHLVRANDLVKSGDPIAISGRTGRATTDHLHFEIRIKGQHVDPNLFYNFRNDRLVADSIQIESMSTGHYRIKSLPSEIKAAGRSLHLSLGDSKEEERSTHIVEAGDTLSIIAQKYRTTIHEICAVNQLTETAVLQIGLRVVLP